MKGCWHKRAVVACGLSYCTGDTHKHVRTHLKAEARATYGSLILSTDKCINIGKYRYWGENIKLLFEFHGHAKEGIP